MSDIAELPKKGYAVIRCVDKTVVAKMQDFPVCDRAVMYRKGDLVSFMPMLPDEIVGTPSLFTKLLESAGYKVTIAHGNPDNIPSSA